jgi:hypothetical protein
MEKKLLVDTITFDVTPEMINESMEKNNGRLLVNGVLQRAEAKNQNGRVYPREILMREAKKYSDVNIKERRALGELDHPDSSVVNLNNVSHNIVEMHWDGDDLVGTVEVLGTPSGNILKELFKAGIKLGISSRGLGSVKNLGEGSVQVQDDFELIAFDFVSNPSTHGAFLKPVNESKNSNIYDNIFPENKYVQINKLITDILTDIK